MIQSLRPNIPVCFLAKYFEVSRSGFYNWLSSERPKSLITKSNIQGEIKEIFEKSKSTYGSPRIYMELKEKGILVSENTVAT